MRDWWVYGTTFSLACAIGVVFVFLADLQDRYGLADWQFGVVAAAGFIAALVTQLGLSPLVDRGIVAPLAWTAVLFGAFGTMGFAFAERFETLILTRGIAGVGLGLFSITARKALLGLDPEGGGKKLGTLLSSGVGGFIIGPGLGALFGGISFGAPFLIVGAAVLVVGIPAAGYIASAPVAATPVDYSDLGALLRTPRIRTALLVQIVIFAFIGVFDSILDRFLTDLGESTAAVAVTLIVMGAPMLILPRIVGRIAEERGSTFLVVAGLTTMAPAVMLYGIAGGATMVALFGILHASGESLAAVSAQVMVLEETGTERIALGNAALDAIGMLMATITAIIAPIVYGRFGAGVLFGGTGLMGLGLTAAVAAGVAVIRQQDANSLARPEQSGALLGGGSVN